MQKLGIFIYSLGSGGAERVVATLLPTLMLKYEVHLILMNDKISYEVPQAVQIHHLEHSQPNEIPIIKLIKLPILGWRFKKMCKNLALNKLFVLLNRPNYVALIARIFGLKIPLIINECTTPSVMYARRTATSLVNKFLIRYLYPKADLILANSQGNLDDLQLNFGIKNSKIRLLKNALDLQKISQLSTENIELEGKFILNVGRLDRGKNHALLLRAFARLCESEKSDLKLVILGEGPLQTHLVSLISLLKLQDKVLLFGFDKNPFKYMSKCEFFVCASAYEGFSNVLLEALACECAIVCSDHKSGARELLGNDEFGLLVSVNDEDALFDGMKKMLNDKNLRENYKEKSRLKAEEFDKTKIARELLNLLKEF